MFIHGVKIEYGILEITSSHFVILIRVKKEFKDMMSQLIDHHVVYKFNRLALLGVHPRLIPNTYWGHIRPSRNKVENYRLLTNTSMR
jgi:hypothetical protein